MAVGIPACMASCRESHRPVGRFMGMVKSTMGVMVISMCVRICR